MREVAQALLRVGPVCRGREDFEGDAARMPADATVGLSPERIVEASFGEREEQGEAVADASTGLGRGRSFPCAGHREDDQHPEAEHDSHQGWDVTQQPQREAPTFHGRHCKRAARSAGLRRGFPHTFAGKWLRLLQKNFLYPPNLDTRLPTKWGVTLGVILGLVPRISVGWARELGEFHTGENQDSRDKPESDSI